MDLHSEDLDRTFRDVNRGFWTTVCFAAVLFPGVIAAIFAFGWQPLLAGPLLLTPPAVYCAIRSRRDWSVAWSLAGVAVLLSSFVLGYFLQLVLVGKQG